VFDFAAVYSQPAGEMAYEGIGKIHARFPIRETFEAAKASAQKYFISIVEDHQPGEAVQLLDERGDVRFIWLRQDAITQFESRQSGALPRRIATLRHLPLGILAGAALLVAAIIAVKTTTMDTPGRSDQSVVSSVWRAANIKEFRAQLDVFHPDEKQTTPEALEDGVEKLIGSGVDRDDAFRAILKVVQEPGINPAMAYQIADIARRVNAVKRGAITR
jgi:hypothetical protein